MSLETRARFLAAAMVFLPGALAGFFLRGGWLALAVACACFGVVMGLYRIESVYYRLRHKPDRPRIERWHDARQVALSAGRVGSMTPDNFADWHCDTGGALPPKRGAMYFRAMRWEFYQVAIGAAVARGLRILFDAIF